MKARRKGGPRPAMTSDYRDLRYWRRVDRGRVPGVGTCRPKFVVANRIVQIDPVSVATFYRGLNAVDVNKSKP